MMRILASRRVYRSGHVSNACGDERDHEQDHAHSDARWRRRGAPHKRHSRTLMANQQSSSASHSVRPCTTSGKTSSHGSHRGAGTPPKHCCSYSTVWPCNARQGYGHANTTTATAARARACYTKPRSCASHTPRARQSSQHTAIAAQQPPLSTRSVHGRRATCNGVAPHQRRRAASLTSTPSNVDNALPNSSRSR
jgi:hypothetical protein